MSAGGAGVTEPDSAMPASAAMNALPAPIAIPVINQTKLRGNARIPYSTKCAIDHAAPDAR